MRNVIIIRMYAIRLATRFIEHMQHDTQHCFGALIKETHGLRYNYISGKRAMWAMYPQRLFGLGFIHFNYKCICVKRGSNTNKINNVKRGRLPLYICFQPFVITMIFVQWIVTTWQNWANSLSLSYRRPISTRLACSLALSKICIHL